MPLALELASFAELVNRKCRIFVLEGNPKNWLDFVKRLQSSSYAEEIFHFDKKVRTVTVELIARRRGGTAYIRMISTDYQQIPAEYIYIF